MRRTTLAAAFTALAALAAAAAAYGGTTPPTNVILGSRIATLPAPPSPGVGPKGYVVVHSGFLTAIPTPYPSLPGWVTHGEVACPTGTVPFAGGALLDSWDFGETINGTYPTAGGWAADINNTSTVDRTFFVYAVCAHEPTGYQVITSDWVTIHGNEDADGPGMGTSCPIGTSVLGGGETQGPVANTAESVRAHLGASYPDNNGRGWEIVMTDEFDDPGSSFQTTTVCGAVRTQYRVVEGSTSYGGAGTQTQLSVDCPIGTVTLGGGAWADTYDSDGLVSMNSTVPIAGGWTVFENNPDVKDRKFQDLVVCE